MKIVGAFLLYAVLIRVGLMVSFKYAAICGFFYVHAFLRSCSMKFVCEVL